MSEITENKTVESNAIENETMNTDIQGAGENQPSAQQLSALLDKIASGTLVLDVPIRAGGEDVTQIHYDFNALTGRDFIAAMDKDRGGSLFQISAVQALHLFAAAAGRLNKGLDQKDIVERISAMDAMEAAQRASLFFGTSARRRGRRSSG